VNFATADGTAVAGTDYTATSGTLTIPAGSTTGTIPVTILAKSTAGPTKTFTVTLSSPVNGTIATGTATGTITNPNSAGPLPASISPDQLGQSASSIPVVISGNAFVSGATVKVSGTGVTLSKVSVVNATTISASAAVSASAAPGARNITVTDSQGSGVCTGCLTIDAGPMVTSVSPSGVSQGTAGSVTFTGSGFVTGATIKVTGPATTVKATKVTVSTSSTLSATITVPAAAPLGAYTVTVTNADGGKGTCTNCLSVIAAPTLTGISPSSVAPGTTKSVVISGTGFATGATLKGPSGVTFSKIVIVNSTTITASMKVASTATAGSNLAITMTNSEAAGFGKAVGDVLTIT
jgi:hypothetical protein